MAAFGVPGGFEIWFMAALCGLLLPGALIVALVLGLRRRGASQPQAAGWLQDPSGRHELRYWDGATWTGSVSDAGVQGVDAL